MGQTQSSVRPPRRLILAGGTGFLGQSMLPALRERYDDVVILTRSPTTTRGEGHHGDANHGQATLGDATHGGAKEIAPNHLPGVRRVHWDAVTSGDWEREIDGAAAIVNLVGRTVDCRKTDANKRVILESRVDSVRALGRACAAAANPPGVWVQAATAHIFGDTGDQILDETSPTGTGFAPDVGRAWERALDESLPPGCRGVKLRISFVLGRAGGPLKTLATLARLMLGGTTGTGRQWMSWIHEMDLTRVVLRALSDPIGPTDHPNQSNQPAPPMTGVYVVTAPEPERNRDFMRHLRRAVGRPWSPPAPAPMVRVGAYLMGTDPQLALLGRRCVPKRLTDEGFDFTFPTLDAALRDLIR